MSLLRTLRSLPAVLALSCAAAALAQAPAADRELLYRDVRVLDTPRGTLGAPTDVLVRSEKGV